MSNEILSKLLLEYDQKKRKAELDLEERKNQLYIKLPRLQEIENELNMFAINTAKNILKGDFLSINNLNLKVENLKEEKEKILKENNISNDYLEPHYECNICKDTGYITQNYSTKMCNCLKQRIFNIEYNKINSFNIANHSLKDFSTSFYASTTNEAKYNSSISPRENIELILKICNNFIKNFDNPNEKNLLFTGNTGLGKTFLSSCIANELLNKNKTILYQTAPIMLDSIINYRLGKSNDFNIIKRWT